MKENKTACLCNKNYTLANTYFRANIKSLVALFIEKLWLWKRVEVRVEKKTKKQVFLFIL